MTEAAAKCYIDAQATYSSGHQCRVSEAFVVAVTVKVTSLVMTLAVRALAPSPKDPHLVLSLLPRQLHCFKRRPLAIISSF
jgi:hypothetical protein